MKLTRRSLASFVSITFLYGSFVRPSSVFAQQLMTRHNATSPDGKKMLRLYAKAVTSMKQKSASGSPDSWIFQWYIHAVNSSTSKSSEIQRLYPNQNDPNRLLADMLWSTCQAHLPGTVQAHFLPWHRAYLIVFEEIVRKECGDPTFTLPYWDYTEDDIIPEEFRMPGDPEFSELFVSNRNVTVNDGAPISSLSGVSREEILNLAAMDETAYSGSSDGASLGFCANIDSQLHGFVHGLVGDVTNMGRVPTAANDPVFWLHHCSIDRIWAGWNALGWVNPNDNAWASSKHHFADAVGNQLSFTNGAVSDTSLLGYKYDSLPIPLLTASSSAVTTAAAPEVEILAASQAAISLGSEDINVRLVRPATAAAGDISGKPASADVKRILSLEGLTTKVQPGVLYNIFAKRKESNLPVYLGSISFFDTENKSVTLLIDVTEKVNKYDDIDPLSYTIVPGGKPATDASMSINSIRLLEK